MTDDGKVTCPQARRTLNRRISKKKLYRTVAWKRAVEAFVTGKSCIWCGATKNLLPHHPYKDTPDEVYTDLELSECVVMCHSCHFHLEVRTEKPCPRCNGWMPNDPTLQYCRKCDLEVHPEKVTAIREKKEEEERRYQEKKDRDNKRRRDAKAKHPCGLYRVGGICGASMINTRCRFSPAKALAQCGDSIAKKVPA